MHSGAEFPPGVKALLFLTGPVVEISGGECLSKKNVDGNLSTQLQHSEQCAMANQWDEATRLLQLPCLPCERRELHS